MKIATSQYPFAFHQNIDAWKSYIEKWIKSAVHERAQVLLFPEFGLMDLMCLFPEIQNDFHKQVIELQSYSDEIDKIFTSLAKKYSIIIIAPNAPSLYLHHIINRVRVYGPNGYGGYQDKIFITKSEREKWNIEQGDLVLCVFETPFGNFGIQICYDIEFAIGAKLLIEAGADIILVPSSTESPKGASRVHIGARARAMEGQCYVVVAQTIGEALWSHSVKNNYGYSAIYSSADEGMPEDGIIALDSPQNAGWLIKDLDLEKLNHLRKHGVVSNYKDSQKIDMNLKNQTLSVRRIKLHG
ncbi:MAG: carbon-nitrogen hydrolase family protein [Chitinophagales bacterium]|nr:carbon-nitrogen hydrolase family protein [Chitinophagales bacterium]MCZ2392361.1 carbon-nitrogen hydrolase family protein [Chitinophagales bacterium]